MRTQADYYTIGTFQLWINDRRRCAKTEEERRGWIRLDAWVNQRVVSLKARYPHQNVHNQPAFRLVEEGFQDE
ncbi:hypothetical protein [Acidithiobacillus ferrooxidans]|uniref:Uncharacterized protein n=1 Tax=Acidithiobacillus ferrooxidans TaxID=920 RepID=A0A2W1KKM3_ACIFR|nr:hypothetical protein [Acidithiobacillus ferrooxidans]MBU2817476.1 hypothetical protein [Acidithiobacillus ferrooxidans]MCR1344018.1 hypothetical protein [Acidithiobacillus ferrooxidans]PZD82394.1 hypothetical protein DN052_05095 [Acidithiobacillus ferrooxidans]QLK41332.1 hypothetical protein FE661_03470 [Acidithiobacillus ferrooxidans]QZT53274.1 hypothetical protein K7B00_03470 [Acidithiobacillus ferrooxidans]